jgi:hypothetical protein
MNDLKISKLVLATMVFFLGATCAYCYPPDNAAVLYYKAAVFGIGDDQTDMIFDFQKGKIELNDKIREFVKRNHITIETVLDASKVKNCDWGLDFSKGVEMMMPPLGPVRDLARLVAADAKILAIDGDYEAAISHCMSLYKMARHVNDRVYICYLVGISINNLTNDCITQIMAEMPQDTQSMTRLKNQLMEINSIPFSVKPAILGEREEILISMTLEQLPDVARLCEVDKTVAEKILSLDQAAIDRNKEYHNNHVACIIDAFDMPYVEGYAAIEELHKKMKEVVKSDPDLFLTDILEPAVQKVFSLSTRSKTYDNAIRTAIELYIVKAKTGKLPDVLPAGLPGDLFSGKDFVYEKTADGFVLHCQGKDLTKDEIQEYKFKVKQ